MSNWNRMFKFLERQSLGMPWTTRSPLVNNVNKPYEIPIKLNCLLLLLTSSNEESAKQVTLRKCHTSSLFSARNFSCSKLEPLSLTHQPSFETFSPDFFLCGAFFELPCEELVSVSFGVEETNCSQ